MSLPSISGDNHGRREGTAPFVEPNAGPGVPPEDGRGFSRPPFVGGPEYTKLLLLCVAYSGVIVLAHWLAYLIRFEFHPPVEMQTLFWRSLEWTLPVELGFLLVFGQFRSLLSYFSFPDANRIVLACAATSLITVGVWYVTGGAPYAPPRSIIILSFLLDTAGLINVRVLFRRLRERQRGDGDDGRAPRRVLIIGAGDVGAHLANEMTSRRDLCMTPVGFLDDDPAKWNMRVHGVTVLGRPEVLGEKRIAADEAVFAMPSAAGRRVREVVQILNAARIPFETVPSIEQMVNGAVRVSQIRPVEIEDLLGREPISLRTGTISNLIKGKTVMVTGAGGSIGAELCRQIAGFHPRRLLLVERCEVQMFLIEQELLGGVGGVEIVPLVADVLDGRRLQGIFGQFRPQLVFHAAAHKHVPMMESQPYEAFRNNAMGTKTVADLAAESGADRFVLISTDKAINPTNAMGATKRLAELYVQALQQHNGTATKFMAVRFGNVLGSSGSVIPTFKRQIAAGGPVTVTHPEVTRYFMTVSEAVGLLLQSATLGEGGEIFVLDMGKRVKIVDLARQLIELSGLRPEADIEIKFTGLRPGEKLFEEIRHDDENLVPTNHPKILRFVGAPLPFETLRQDLLAVIDRATPLDANQFKREIRRLVPEYSPELVAPDAPSPLSDDQSITWKFRSAEQ